MRYLFVAATFLLLLFFGNGVYGFERATEIYGGCHEFFGRIFCEDGSAILPTAKVGLWEADAPFLGMSTDDWITAAPVARDGSYRLSACVWDYTLGLWVTFAQVYLEFRHACPGVEYSYAHVTLPGKHYDYQIPLHGHYIKRGNIKNIKN